MEDNERKNNGRMIIDGEIVDLNSKSIEEIEEYIKKMEEQRDKLIASAKSIMHVDKIEDIDEFEI